MKNCRFDPTIYKDAPIGMFHCPGCGEMVLAGFPHHKEEPKFWKCSGCGRDKFSRPGQPHWCNGIFRKRFRRNNIFFTEE